MRFVHIAWAVATAGLLLGGGVSPSCAQEVQGLGDTSAVAAAPAPGTPDTSVPTISIFSPSDGAKFSGSEAKIIYSVAQPSGSQLAAINVLVDGRPVATRRGLERPDDLPQKPGQVAGEVVVPLPHKDVTVSLIARAGDRLSAPATVKLVWDGPGVDGLKPKLYAVVVGVSHYTDPTLTLRYAAKDAIDFAAALQAQTGGLYADVQAKVFADDEATRHNIIVGLEWLKRQVTSNDVGVVYLAGHGWTDEAGNFWFLPVGATPADLDLAVAKDDLLRPLDGMAGRALLFIDACHAASTARTDAAHQALARGSADMDSVIRDFGANAGRGIVTFASSTGREVSLERDDWGNGAFTKALVEGLRDGKAAVTGSGEVTLSSLNHYVADRVKLLTGGIQHPIMNQNDVPDFPIGMARPPGAESEAAKDAAAPAVQPSTEVVFWQSIVNSRRKADFQAYLDQFPNGAFAALARTRVAELEQPAGGGLDTDAPARAPVNPPPPPGEASDADSPPIKPIAALPSPSSSIDRDSASVDLVRSVQKELARVGCVTGSIDGVWAQKSRTAVKEFARYARVSLASPDPSEELLMVLKAQSGRVCPLACAPPLYEAKGDSCVRKTCPSGMTLSSRGNCIASVQPKKPNPAVSAGTKKPPIVASGGACQFGFYSCKFNAGGRIDPKHPNCCLHVPGIPHVQ